MSDHKLHSEHLSERDIKGYLNSSLSDQEMHRIERHLLSCDFCAEAMEGYETIPTIDPEFEINELNTRIAQRIEKKEKRNKFASLRIAAIAIALIISGIFVSNYFIKNLRQEKLTEKRKSELKENNIKKDSIQAPKSIEKSATTNTQKEEKAPAHKPQIPERKVSETTSELSDTEVSHDDYMIVEADDELEEIEVIEFNIALDNSEKTKISAPMQSMGRSAAKKEIVGYAAENTIQNEEVLQNASPTMNFADEVNALSGVSGGAEIMETKTIKNLNAQPSIGFDAYKLYLIEEVNFPLEAIENDIKGKVILQFDLDSLGNMDHFVIEKGLGFGCDEEAIRLIKEGPSWNPAIKEGQLINQEVKIKINFK